MHAQGLGQHLEVQVVAFQRLAVEVDVQALCDLDLHPGQACAHEHGVQAPAVVHQLTQRADHLLRRRQDADIQQPVISQCTGAQHMPATGLATVTDAQREQLAFPMEIRAFQFTVGGFQFTEAG